ncbi:unnamed protein product [Albugo candida]|uniref:Uncharacterized protein n=1 Tax=Albugo candida TaxID=65357 RepID=A0A024FWN9_9STRA|nr:unnamed protein product [Albugo candida]|eukprot:CCI11510.1 unnamed protein product [Albugo candida]
MKHNTKQQSFRCATCYDSGTIDIKETISSEQGKLLEHADDSYKSSAGIIDVFEIPFLEINTVESSETKTVNSVESENKYGDEKQKEDDGTNALDLPERKDVTEDIIWKGERVKNENKHQNDDNGRKAHDGTNANDSEGMLADTSCVDSDAEKEKEEDLYHGIRSNEHDDRNDKTDRSENNHEDMKRVQNQFYKVEYHLLLYSLNPVIMRTTLLRNSRDLIQFYYSKLVE